MFISFFKTILNAKKISFIKKPFYFYRRHKKSLTTSNTKNFLDSLPVFTQILHLFNDDGFYEQYKKPLLNHKIDRSIFWFSHIDTEFKSDYFYAMKKDFKKIDENEKLSKDFRELLNSDYLSYYKNVLKASNYNEFELLCQIQKLNNKINDLTSVNKKLKKTLDELFSSRSWKITEPLRKLKFMFKK